VRVNGIAPGLIYNPFLDRIYDKAWFEAKAKETVLGRMGRAEDVTGLAVFLCSEEAGFITGQVLSINGATTTR
jgi:3-oxoacyl-[acyl-carrier protein] reductase